MCGGDDPEDLTVNSSQGGGHINHQQHHHAIHHGGGNNNQLRYGPGDAQHLHQQQQAALAGKFPTAMELIDSYARSGGGGALSPFLPFAKDGGGQPGGDKIGPYTNKAFLDSYLKALVETNPPLFYASKIAGEMIKHDIAADDAEYSSASDADDDGVDDDEDDEDEDDDDVGGRHGGDEEDADGEGEDRAASVDSGGRHDGGSVNAPLPLQAAGKN